MIKKLARKRLLIIFILSGMVILLSFTFGLPVFAQSYVATLIPNQPLKSIAAQQIIINSGLPKEKLLDGTTNAVTRGRDAVNAYRYAHSMLYTKGWYRGISSDHTSLLVAMVAEIEKEGFTSIKKMLQDKTPEALAKFWYASDTENAKELGYSSLEAYYSALKQMGKEGKVKESGDLAKAFDSKWK